MTTIRNILEQPALFENKIAKIDGIFIVDQDDRLTDTISICWIEEFNSDAQIRIQVTPIATDSILWQGIKRLKPRIRNSFFNYRIHDGLRAYGRVIYDPATKKKPTFELLTAVIDRGDYSVFVGIEGVSLHDAVTDVEILEVNDIQKNPTSYFRKSVHIRGTLVVNPSKKLQYLIPTDLISIPKDDDRVAKSSISIDDNLKRNLKEKYHIEIEPEEVTSIIEDILQSGLSLIFGIDVEADYWISNSL